MLAAWFRIKYPHLVDGSLASSAPVTQVDFYDYGRILTEIIRNTNEKCSLIIRKVWDIINNLGQVD